MADEQPILEPTRAPAIFVTGIGPVNVNRDFVHFMLTSDQCRLDAPGTDRIAVARITIARDRLAAVVKQLRAALK